MKIRTITLGFNYNENNEIKDFRNIGILLNKLKNYYKENKYFVQTIRATTQPWDNYFQSKNQIIKLVKKFEKYSKKYNIDYFNIGPTFENNNISLIYDIINNTSIGFCTAYLSKKNNIGPKIEELT